MCYHHPKSLHNLCCHLIDMKPVLDYDFTEYVSDAALPIPDNATNSSSGNNTGLYMLSNCTNDYCMNDEDYIALVEKYIFPTPVEWIFITLHCIVFIVGLVGNVLVCLAVYRNQNMRTVTNYFIVNLALADFMVILVCLPPTVLWDVTETWFFGSVLCKVVLYIQAVSVSVSVLTLTFISVDRWYAICFPLNFKSTTNRAKIAIFIIWFLSLSLVFPELIVYDIRSSTRVKIETIYFTDCTATWSDESQKTYQIILLAVLYISPFLLMSVAYHQIVRVLWTNDMPVNSESKIISCKSITNKKGITSRPNISSDGQIRSRRKAAKMLIAIVIMFGVCYFPVHLLNVLRYWIKLPQNDFTVTISLLSHWLCYANSAMNPVIYNFMSGKFRKEFRNVFTCFLCRGGHPGRMRGPTMTYSCRYTSTSTHMDTINLNSITI